MLSRFSRTCTHSSWFKQHTPSANEYLSFSIYRTTAVELPSAEVLQDYEASPVTVQQPAGSTVPDFDNHATAFRAKPTLELARSLAVFSACGFKPLVKNADCLIPACCSLLGPGLTHGVVKHTFFSHFCAGETEAAIQPRLAFLRSNGISPILNYAVEDDVGKSDEHDEAPCDANLARFLKSIADCNVASARGFMAIKMSALASPDLLQKLSRHLTALGDDLDRGRFSASLRATVSPCLTAGELSQFDRLLERLHTVAAAAQDKGNLRCMVDAEQSYMQPVMDALTIQLQQRFNRSVPVIFNTYQCYLKSTEHRLQRDLARAASEGWKLGLKTVRGAYMHVEQSLALDKGVPSPIHSSLADTHGCYDRCVAGVLERVAQGQAELMVATHNQASVEQAVAAMQRLDIQPSPTSGVYFGTLLGMADHLSFTLGPAQYNPYKMVPYGPVPEVMAYLLRRVRENSDIMGGCAKEAAMIRAELKRRMLSWTPPSQASSCASPA